MKICFTGRRPKDLFWYDSKRYIPLVEALKRDLRVLIDKGYDTFISGGAQGFDQLAFWAVNRLKTEGYNIKNIVYVPFDGQEKMWKEEGLFSQQEYRKMLSLADEVVVLREIDRTVKYEVVNALHDRNHSMVNDVDLVFGLYPNSSWINKSTKGGTAECLRYAKSQNKKIYVLSNETYIGEYFEYEKEK